MTIALLCVTDVGLEPIAAAKLTHGLIGFQNITSQS